MPLLHLDAGDVFQNKYEVSEADRPGVLAAADVFIDAFERMDVKAVNIGDRDLALGIDTLKALDKKSKFPLLSSNIQKDGKAVFTPSILVTVGGRKVGIIGAVTALFVNRQKLESSAGIKVLSADQTVPTEVARLKAQGAELFILLGHLNETEVDAVAKAAPELNFVLGGQWLKMDATLSRKGSAFVAGGYMRGKNLSVLDLHVRGDSLDFVDRHAKLALQKRQQQLKLQIRSREQSIERARTNKQAASRSEFLQQNLVRLKTELQEITMDLEDLEEPDQNASFVVWEMKGMDTSFKDDEHVAGRVAEYRKVHPDPTKKPRPRTPPAPVKREKISPKNVPNGPRAPRPKRPAPPKRAR